MLLGGGTDDPERWEPAERRTFARLVGDDRAQARALVRAAGARRIVVESEGGEDAESLAREVRAAARAAGARLAETPGPRGAVIYAGTDPVGAAGVAESVAREAPGARIVLPDAIARADTEGLIKGAAARRTVFVSSAPRPGSTPELRAFEADFERAYGRAPGPYAALGHAAMATVLARGRARGAGRRGRDAPACDRRVLLGYGHGHRARPSQRQALRRGLIRPASASTPRARVEHGERLPARRRSSSRRSRAGC